MLNDVVLNQVLVRAATDEQTLALIAAVQQDGTCWCGPTVWQHRPAMRISISGWATTAEDIKQERRRHHRRNGRDLPHAPVTRLVSSTGANQQTESLASSLQPGRQ